MRKRSKYRPKPVIADPLSFVISGLKPINSHGEAALDLRIKNHSALSDIQQGRGTRATVDILIGALNVTEALARTANLGDDWAGEIRAAQDALLAMASRGAPTNRFVFTGPELTAVNVAMELHDEQLNHCTVGQLEKAVAFVNQMHRCGASRKIKHHRKDHETNSTTPDKPTAQTGGHVCRPTHSHRDQARQDHGGAEPRPSLRRSETRAYA